MMARVDDLDPRQRFHHWELADFFDGSIIVISVPKSLLPLL